MKTRGLEARMAGSEGRSTDFLAGMVVALPAEARAMLGRCRWTRQGEFHVTRAPGLGGADAVWVRSGLGAERAAAAAALLLEQGVTHLGVAGVSGGLAPDMASGQLVLASEVMDETGRRWPADRPLLADLAAGYGGGIRVGPVLTAEAPVLTAAAKARRYASLQALAVDMESAAVAKAAAAAGRPFFALRAICDSASCTVPESLFDLVDEAGRPRFVRLAATLARHPALLADLWRMQRDFGHALRALRMVFRNQQRISFE